MKTDKSSKRHDSARVTDQKARPKTPLVSSPTVAEREIAGLHRGDAEREAAPSTGATDARATLI